MNDSDELIFDAIVPLPYRILFVVQLGHLGWYLIVKGCYKIGGMNVLLLINMSYTSHNYAQMGASKEPGEDATINEAPMRENDLLLFGIWRNLVGISVHIMVSYVVFTMIRVCFEVEPHRENSTWVKFLYHSIPLITTLVVAYRIFHKQTKSVGKTRLFTTMKRIIVGDINSQFMRTNDILLSDSLMSYSKVLNDIGIFIWHYFISNESVYNIGLEFVMLCIPSVIRISQCWCEYKLTRSRNHLLNMGKYSVGIMPILLTFLIKINLEYFNESKGNDTKEDNAVNIRLLNVWWYLASFISSTYSFIWDVKMDWDLNVFDYLLNKSATILRPKIKLVYNTQTWVYYLVIFVDFMLRYLWVLKYFVIKDSEHLPLINRVGLFLFGYNAFSFGYCLIEVMEIFRRFMWCFFKLESDWVKMIPEEVEMGRM